MVFWLWAVIGVLVCVILGLLVKLYLMRKSAREIEAEFALRLTTDTNTLIDISSRDRCMRALAGSINAQLRALRAERQRFQQGDQELKDAVTNISHDLRTPLTAICGYLDLLEREEKTETAERYLSLIGNRTEALKQLTEELFCYSVLSSTREERRENLSLRSLLEESIAAYYGAFVQQGITPEISLPEGEVERRLDRASILRIFGNIISNVLKYSEGDCVVTLREDGTVTFANRSAGLDNVTVGRLFDRFYTVETGRSSTGLGLAIAKLLTERMGGSIRAECQGDRLELILQFPEED